MKRLSWILTLPLTLVAVAFAVANRGVVTLDLWPFEVSIGLPLFVIVLVSLFLGLLLGGLTMWLSAGRIRRRARNAERKAANLERDVARLTRERERRTGAPQPGAPLPDTRPPALPNTRDDSGPAKLPASGA